MKIEFFSNNEKKVLKTPRNIKNSEVTIRNSKWSIILSVKKDKSVAKQNYRRKISSLGIRLLRDKILLSDFLSQKEKAREKLSKRCVVVKFKKDNKSLVKIQKSLFELL